MINKPNVEELLKKTTNRYKLINAVSQRARQLIAGATPKVETNETSKVTISALELEKDKYFIED